MAPAAKLLVFGEPSSLASSLVSSLRRSASSISWTYALVHTGYISRSVAGSYDNEAIAIFILTATFALWQKALREGSALYGTLTALFYFYMVGAWGRLSTCSFEVNSSDSDRQVVTLSSQTCSRCTSSFCSSWAASPPRSTSRIRPTTSSVRLAPCQSRSSTMHPFATPSTWPLSACLDCCSWWPLDICATASCQRSSSECC